MTTHLFRMATRLAPLLAVSVIACTTTPGTRPHDMSEAGHENAAQAEMAQASSHGIEAAPDAAAGESRCRARPLRGEAVEAEACWSSTKNPTDVHRRVAEEHRRAAAEHRAASAALRDAEASACAGIADADRDMSPLERVEDIGSVSPIGSTDAPKGAAITFRAVAGLTKESLQRLVDCHLARNAALGHVVPEMPNCPLVPNHVAATVAGGDAGLTVQITSDDPSCSDASMH